MSLINKKKSKELAPTNGQAKPQKPEENFEIVVSKQKAQEMDAFLENVPHGIAKNVIAFFQSCERRALPQVKNDKITVP